MSCFHRICVSCWDNLQSFEDVKVCPTCYEHQTPERNMCDPLSMFIATSRLGASIREELISREISRFENKLKDINRHLEALHALKGVSPIDK